MIFRILGWSSTEIEFELKFVKRKVSRIHAFPLYGSSYDPSVSYNSLYRFLNYCACLIHFFLLVCLHSGSTITLTDFIYGKPLPFLKVDLFSVTSKLLVSFIRVALALVLYLFTAETALRYKSSGWEWSRWLLFLWIEGRLILLPRRFLEFIWGWTLFPMK